MTDSLRHLARQLDQFAKDRDWQQFHSPKNLASALVVEAGGHAALPDGSPPKFNRADTLLPGLVTTPSSWRQELEALGVVERR